MTNAAIAKSFNFKKQSKSKFLDVLFYILFLIVPFVQSVSSDFYESFYGANVLPPIVSTTADLARWVILGLFLLFFITNIRNFRIEQKWLCAFFAFYFFQFLYSLFTFSDTARYSVLLAEAISLPLIFAYIFKVNGLNLSLLRKIIYFFIVFSIAFNIKVFFRGFRFFGFLNNPNLYGLCALFWLSILLIDMQKKSRLNNIFIFVLIATIISTGSRNALIGLLIIFMFSYVKDVKRLIIFCVLLLLSFLAFISFLAYYSDLGRLLDIQNAASDSGRFIYWQKAIALIERNPFWGYGMDAPEKLVDTANMHNCYLRYILMIGSIFFLFSMSFYLYFLYRVFKNRRFIPESLVGFLFAFTLMNVGEDFFIGAGSTAVIYFCLSIGMILYCLSPKKAKKGFY